MKKQKEKLIIFFNELDKQEQKSKINKNIKIRNSNE
jgi:hypothetical protein